MDLINVPTSVATCAAVASVCIMYHEDGTPDGSLQMSKTPDVIIADTDVIATAPRRTLAAGIFDSIAKHPEVLHNRPVDSYKDCSLEKYICVVNSKAIYDVLMGEGLNVYQNGIASGRMTDIILTNLLHTAIVSGFSCGVDQLAVISGSHPGRMLQESWYRPQHIVPVEKPIHAKRWRYSGAWIRKLSL